MIALIRRYTHWLHTQWPAGTVEKLPEVSASGITNVPGVYVSGDLTGVPLLKFSLETGARVVQEIAADARLRRSGNGDETIDLVIVGAGVSGMAAAVEAKKLGLSCRVVEASQRFFTLVNFPKGKPIYTYPHEMTPAGDLQVSAAVKEPLIEELEAQVRAASVEVEIGRVERIERAGGALRAHVAGGQPITCRRVLVAIGRSGNFRRLGVAGEDRDKVFNRLHDPRDYCSQKALVVGGGDSALETAIALASCGADVTLSYRKNEFSRPKPDNIEMIEALRRDPTAAVAIEHPSDERVTTATGRFQGEPDGRGSITLALGTQVESIDAGHAVLVDSQGQSRKIENDVVFSMIGREPPLDFFRRSGIAIANEMNPKRWASLAAFFLFCSWLYNWKSGGSFDQLWRSNGWFPYNLPDWLASLGGAVQQAAADPHTLIGTLAISATGSSFWYTLAYSLIVVVFGIKRIRRRKTPYVTAQTLTLMAVQVFPLFLIPEIILPLLDYHGWLPAALGNALFPEVTYGHGREFWRAYGLILAWPLNVYNIFTHEPLWWWIGIGFVQTCVLIPLGIYFFGKGVYCGWICSCGALAETLGDTHRHKMPHGPLWNRLNMIGQGVLLIAVIALLVRIVGWILPGGNWADRMFDPVFKDPYKWGVDVFLAGVVGYGLYFWYSGRVWCRFMCPLAALMHVYARFSSFRILADKKKCISCNVCTSVCHQGIDIMNFANKGAAMADPECVRCSACVQSCPTGVLSFGRVNRQGELLSVDSLMASPVQARERA